MKSIFLFVIILISANSIIYSQNSCVTAEPFCSGVTYTFPMSINTVADAGPNYGCLCTKPNPVWYFARIGQPGDITINISSPNHDVDFVCWGPYSNPLFPFLNQLTSSCTGCSAYGCPNNTINPNFYPAGNVVDCSYDPSPNENLHIKNALSGEYYIICITNYANTPGNLTFFQSNYGQTGAGVTDCSFMQNQYVNGTVFWDMNNNNIKDSTETGISGAIVYINGCFGAMSENDGSYSLYTCNANDVIQISLPASMASCNVTPASWQLSISQSVYDFAVYMPPSSDLSVELTHYGSVMPDAFSNYLIEVDNNSNDTNSGYYQLLLDSGLTYVSSAIPYDSVNNNLYIWNFSGIMPLSSIQNTIMVLSDSGLTDQTTVTSYANVNADQQEISLLNNADTSEFVILSTYNPNFIVANPPDTLTQSFIGNGGLIEYTINFQNTGNSVTNKVKISNPMPDYLIDQSYEVISSSHPCDVIYNSDGSLVFLFNNINLPVHVTNFTGSCGFVKYRVRCNPMLQVGDYIRNTADIFLDFNPVISTNTTENFLVDSPVSVNKDSREYINLFPVPSGDFVNVESPNTGGGVIEVYNLNGTKVKELVFEGSNTKFYVADLKAGIYQVKLKYSDGVKFGKLVVK